MPDKVIRKDCIKQYKPGCSPFKAVVLDRRLFGNVWVLVSVSHLGGGTGI